MCIIRRCRRTAIGALIGDRLRDARVRRGFKGNYVAKRLGVSPATYSQIESGQRVLTVQRLDTIRFILGLTWAQLLAAESEKIGGQSENKYGESENYYGDPENFYRDPENPCQRDTP